jgi:TatD DNase family protein
MVDTHCHLIDPQFNKDFDEQAHRYEWLMPAVGIHPNEAAEQSLTEMSSIIDVVQNNKVCAIGETGLDYYRDFSSKEAQQELFRKHISLARSQDLPLLIHTRNSVDDAIGILKEEDFHHGVFHCYSGTYEQAKMILGMGYYLGFGGVLTFSKRTRDVFKNLPTDRILLETDAPFLSPSGHRGQRNEPAYILETLSFAAGTLEMLPEQLEEILDANVARLFPFSV